jgi:nucleotide sugar dehydrogenase
VDVNVVAKGMGLDSRIGSKFLHAGAGFGGSCFPKDSLALIQMGAANGIRLELLESVIRVNHGQRARILEKVTRLVGGLRGKTIGVLGLAFKPNTDDLREAPAIELVESLLAAGAAVKAFDPAATDQAATLYPSVEMCKDAYAVADGADALVLMTEWNQFRNLDLGRIRNALRQPSSWTAETCTIPRECCHSASSTKGWAGCRRSRLLTLVKLRISRPTSDFCCSLDSAPGMHPGAWAQSALRKPKELL